MYQVYLFFLFSLDFRYQAKPTETNIQWLPSSFGIWQDAGDEFSAYLPDVDDSVFHFGPARLWGLPIQRSRYGIICSIFVLC